jgi:hypothetical protein
MNAVEEHKQVPFQLMNGKMVTVDAGVLELMTLLRDAGIKTLYSCEDNLGLAYVCMPMRDGLRFRRLIRWTGLDKKFLSGHREVRFSGFLSQGTRQLFEFACYIKKRGGRKSYRTEHCINNYWGFRTTYRWPASDNEYVLEMLERAVRSREIEKEMLQIGMEK